MVDLLRAGEVVACGCGLFLFFEACLNFFSILGAWKGLFPCLELVEVLPFNEGGVTLL